MDSPRALRIAADVQRLAPVLALVGTIVIDLPSLIGAFHRSISLTSALERLVVSFGFAFLASRALAALLIRYLSDSVARAEDQHLESSASTTASELPTRGEFATRTSATDGPAS
jgi:hypothetical protein